MRITTVIVVGWLAAAAFAASSAARGPHLEGPFGRGASQVWVLVPVGKPRSIVVFGHGWKVTPPSPALAWVDQFRPWLDHLAVHGSVVVFPRYQAGGDSLGTQRVLAYRRGLSAAFRRLRGIRVPVVATGYSYGASLAFYYAGEAKRWRVPVPAAVDAVFPAGPIGALPPALPSTMRVLIQVGDRDVEAGAGGAAAFWTWLRRRPHGRERYEVVMSRGGFVAVHASPKQTTDAARRAFWRPLDKLVDLARRG